MATALKVGAMVWLPSEGAHGVVTSPVRKSPLGPIVYVQLHHGSVVTVSPDHCEPTGDHHTRIIDTSIARVSAALEQKRLNHPRNRIRLAAVNGQRV